MFNELSVEKFDAVAIAHDRMKLFVKTCSRAREIGWKSLRLHESIGENVYYIEISDNYFVGKWVEECKEKDVVSLFKGIITESPLLKGDDDKQVNDWGNTEYSINGDIAKGLGAAHFMDTLAVSFWEESSRYYKEFVKVHCKVINEDLKINEFDVDVVHASLPEHVDKHKIWFEERIRKEAENRKDLWEKRETYFPNLIFCGETEKNLTQGETLAGISRVFEKLKRLNDYAAEWKEGGFSVEGVAAKGVDVSNESDSTMQHPRLKNMRKFRLPNGEKETFEPHIKTAGLRFHFYADEATHQIYVGYIGKHLPTSSDN